MREIGKRTQRPTGEPRPPTPEERKWVEKMAQHPTRIPKGVFRYRSHEEANRDWEKWHVEQVVELADRRQR
ncbi:hypothetical protein [Endothiovibrio diazotrophicus]